MRHRARTDAAKSNLGSLECMRPLVPSTPAMGVDVNLCPFRTFEPPSLTSISVMSYPFADVDGTNLPTAVDIDYFPGRIRQNLFDRLHWIVFGLQSDIAVQDGNAIVSFANHAIGLESIAGPPSF